MKHIQPTEVVDSSGYSRGHQPFSAELREREGQHFCAPQGGSAPFSHPAAQQCPIFAPEAQWHFLHSTGPSSHPRCATAACFCALQHSSVPFLHSAVWWHPIFASWSMAASSFHAPRAGSIPFLCPMARQHPIFTARGIAVSRSCVPQHGGGVIFAPRGTGFHFCTPQRTG